MNKLLLIPFAIFTINVGALACELPKGEKIVVGCTFGCDFIYRFRLSMAARSLGYPISIVNLRTWGEMSHAIESVDAVLIPGGADIDPEYYLRSVDAELQNYTRANLNLVKFSKEGEYRDPFEYNLITSYIQNKKYEKLPLLGICRGMQMMAVARGIPLYLDIKQELGIRNRKNLFDRIYITDENSNMRALYGSKKIRGFKRHHQGIRTEYYEKHKDKFPQAIVTAKSNRGLISESLEYLDRPALGVQYHPEKSFSGSAFPVFKWFFTKACEYKNSPKDNQ